MAIVDTKAVNYTKKYVTVPPEMVHSSWEGKVMAFLDTMEVSASDAGAVLYFFRPPRGSRWNGVGWIATDALGTSVTCAVGTSATAYARTGVNVNWATKTPAVAVPAAFLAATSHASAAKTALGLIASIDVVGYEFDGETDVIVTTAGAALTAGTVKLYFEVIAP